MPSAGQTIVLVSPVFLLLLLWEAWILRERAHAFGIADTISSLSMGILSRLVLFIPLAISFNILGWIQQHGSWSALSGFWSSPLGWLVAFIFYDFCYYWYHRIGHERSLFWASHSVHHQSQFYNLSTALRQSGTAFLVAWIFYTPMALLGVGSEQIVIVGLLNLLYQYWIHTEAIGRLGWFDRWFASPSNHRVHHGVNDAYLDKNYSGVFMVWDHLFGTYQDEDANDPPIYGTRSPLNTWSPVRAHTQVLATMLHDCLDTKSWRDKFYIWFSRTGWRPADCERSKPYPAFDISRVQRYDPQLTGFIPLFCLVWFGLSVLGAFVFLWNDQNWPFTIHAIGFVTIFVQIYMISKVLDGKLSLPMALMLAFGFIAMLSANMGEPNPKSTTEAWWWGVHAMSKSLTLCFAVYAVMKQILTLKLEAPERTALYLLLAACCFSWLGDVLLLNDAWFVMGLSAFLMAHLAYLARFKWDSSWFPSKAALIGYALLGAAMYTWLWIEGLDASMRLPVFFYCLVISIMAAQATGRAIELKSTASFWVAAGAFLFMLSDAIIAYDKFIQPLAHAPAWILSLYFIAQGLMISNLMKAESTPA